jgi:predicted phosphoribosyltransferase
MFRDRSDAGRKLAAALAPVVRAPAVVAGIPRGGVAVALPIVERLRVPLTVVYARKLTSELAPELAVGALDEDGEVIVDPRTVAVLGIDTAELGAAKARVAAEIRRRMDLYRVPPLSRYLPGAAVVLVDDGLATGLTMRAALAYARRRGAREVTVAVACASEEAAERFRREADRFVSLVVDPHFQAVGAYYQDFSPVTDEEVLAMLTEAAKAAEAPVPLASD